MLNIVLGTFSLIVLAGIAGCANSGEQMNDKCVIACRVQEVVQ